MPKDRKGESKGKSFDSFMKDAMRIGHANEVYHMPPGGDKKGYNKEAYNDYNGGKR